MVQVENCETNNRKNSERLESKKRNGNKIETKWEGRGKENKNKSERQV